MKKLVIKTNLKKESVRITKKCVKNLIFNKIFNNNFANSAKLLNSAKIFINNTTFFTLFCGII